MSQPDEPHLIYRWNIAKLATAFGLHRDTVTARLQKAGVEPVATSGRSLLFDLKEAAAAVFRDVPVGSCEPEQMDPSSRRMWFQSENERLRFETDTGHVHRDFEVAHRMSVITKQASNLLDSLPDVIERECGASPEQLQKIEQTIDRLREQIYAEASA